MRIKQEGAGLIEMMISLTLASILIAALMQHYLSLKRQYLHSQSLLEQEFELQLINDLLRDSVRRAGFTPCLAIDFLQTINHGNEKAKLSALEVAGGKHPFLRFARMSEYFTTVLSRISPRQLLLQSGRKYEAGDSILIADCYHAELQQILHTEKTNAGTLILLKKPLAFHYQEPIYLGEWIEEKFFIQKNRRGEAALFYQTKQAEELSSAVNDLNVSLKTKQGRTLVQVILRLVKGQSLVIETEVRAE